MLIPSLVNPQLDKLNSNQEVVFLRLHSPHSNQIVRQKLICQSQFAYVTERKMQRQKVAFIKECEKNARKSGCLIQLACSWNTLSDSLIVFIYITLLQNSVAKNSSSTLFIRMNSHSLENHWFFMDLKPNYILLTDPVKPGLLYKHLRHSLIN